ncbi:DUF6434 domain-containing protein [Solibacillus daqui]|uniref:DUF6434 domain-containing protein n=1 Tax=Solibacillus daqui TaxID=2912187 RepID=UPI0023672AD0|nr:DUF6434 domain-containing protein [Solibacillus daqui]
MRPLLNKDIQIHDFLNYYWLKEELQQFCREHGLSATGSKADITNRIKLFLDTSEVVKPERSQSSKQSVGKNNLTLETLIKKGHTCSQPVRHFFKQHIPNFHFSTYIQNYFKENIGKTYQDVINAWHKEQHRLKDPTYTKKIAPQFEYNQFIRDYFADPANKAKTRNDAIAAWNVIKSQPGDNKYKLR